MNKYTLAPVAAISLLLLSACAAMQGAPSSARADMEPTRGSQARGVVQFVQDGDKVKVTATFSGLTPGGHGFHIHEKGDCSAPDATSAGGHFNPAGKPHGHPHQGEHHVGDLPMLQADANGNASLTASLSGMKLTRDSDGIIGRGVIGHAAPDDFKTQPTGNSGARVACGVITAR
jgi:Cu-Zn family superoxide dismutase